MCERRTGGCPKEYSSGRSVETGRIGTDQSDRGPTIRFHSNLAYALAVWRFQLQHRTVSFKVERQNSVDLVFGYDFSQSAYPRLVPMNAFGESSIA
jgi:hypothetical protein